MYGREGVRFVDLRKCSLTLKPRLVQKTLSRFYTDTHSSLTVKDCWHSSCHKDFWPLYSVTQGPVALIFSFSDGPLNYSQEKCCPLAIFFLTESVSYSIMKLLIDLGMNLFFWLQHFIFLSPSFCIVDLKFAVVGRCSSLPELVGGEEPQGSVLLVILLPSPGGILTRTQWSQFTLVLMITFLVSLNNLKKNYVIRKMVSMSP